jgi:hypothetical protein
MISNGLSWHPGYKPTTSAASTGPSGGLVGGLSACPPPPTSVGSSAVQAAARLHAPLLLLSLSSIALCQLFMAFLGNVDLVLLIKSLCVLNVAFRVHASELCLHENICSPCSQPAMLKRTKKFIICPYTTQIFC